MCCWLFTALFLEVWTFCGPDLQDRTAESSRLQKQRSTQSTAHSHSTVKCNPSVTVTESSPWRWPSRIETCRSVLRLMISSLCAFVGDSVFVYWQTLEGWRCQILGLYKQCNQFYICTTQCRSILCVTKRYDYTVLYILHLFSTVNNLRNIHYNFFPELNFLIFSLVVNRKMKISVTKKSLICLTCRHIASFISFQVFTSRHVCRRIFAF
jgi:hypothetical protein